MVFAKNDRTTTRIDALPVAFEDGSARPRGFDVKMSRADREASAGGESYEVHGVGHERRFVEVVDSPHQATFAVTPRAEILHMQIPHANHFRCVGEWRAQLRPQLR